MRWLRGLVFFLLIGPLVTAWVFFANPGGFCERMGGEFRRKPMMGTMVLLWCAFSTVYVVVDLWRG